MACRRRRKAARNDLTEPSASPSMKNSSNAACPSVGLPWNPSCLYNRPRRWRTAWKCCHGTPGKLRRTPNCAIAPSPLGRWNAAREEEANLVCSTIPLRDRQVHKVGCDAASFDLMSGSESDLTLDGFRRLLLQAVTAGTNAVDAEIAQGARRMIGIIDSMTRGERSSPTGSIDKSRRRRISAGAGVTSREVSDLLQQFGCMRNIIGRIKRTDAAGHSWFSVLNEPKRLRR